LVLLKITKHLSGSIDGLHLGRFAVGEVYDVGTSLANYLLALGAAEPVRDEPSEGGRAEQREPQSELPRRLSGDPPRPTKAEDRKRRPPKKP
jgi:hypothetical protein